MFKDLPMNDPYYLQCHDPDTDISYQTKGVGVTRRKMPLEGYIHAYIGLRLEVGCTKYLYHVC